MPLFIYSPFIDNELHYEIIKVLKINELIEKVQRENLTTL